MKKILFLILFISVNFSFGQKTKKQLEVLKIVNSKMFYSPEVLVEDIAGGIKWGVLDFDEYEIGCIGYYVGKKQAEGKIKELRKLTYLQIFKNSKKECENKSKKDEYNNTKFTTIEQFKLDTEIAIKNQVIEKTQKNIECALKYLNESKKLAIDTRKNTYEEIFENGAVLCGNPNALKEMEIIED